MTTPSLSLRAIFIVFFVVYACTLFAQTSTPTTYPSLKLMKTSDGRWVFVKQESLATTPQTTTTIPADKTSDEFKITGTISLGPGQPKRGKSDLVLEGEPQPTKQPQTEMSWKGIIAAVALSAFLVFIIVAIGAGYYQSKIESSQKPLEPLPPRPKFPRDEPWRKPTTLRFLENLKKDLVGWENRLLKVHEGITRQYGEIPNQKSKFELGVLYDQIRGQLEDFHELQQQIPTLRPRIEKVFAGNVSDEIVDLEVQIKKLQREKQELMRSLTETQQELKTATGKEKRSNLEGAIADLREEIKEGDLRIIELESDFKELKGFDFRKLYRELGLPGPPGLANLDEQHLKDIKTKSDILKTINPLTAATSQEAPREKSEDDEKFQKHRAKRQIDIEHQIFEEFELPFTKELELQQAYKKKRREIYNHPQLTDEEKDHFLDRLDICFKEKMKDGGFSIYEDD